MSSEVIPKGWLQVNIIFRVENFSKLKVAATSEPHYLQDHEGKLFRNLAWKILVAPHLQGPGIALENPALVFYVKSCIVGEAPESERCETAAIILRIINHNDSRLTYERRFPRGISFGCQSGPWSNYGADYRNPHSWKDLADPDLGFIKDGTVTFEANIRVHEDLFANIPNPGRLYLRDPNVPKAKKKKTSKKITARKMQQRKTYKKSMLKAAEDGFQRIVENLVLEAGVDVDTMFEDEDDQTALHRATIHERKEMVECLIKLGATTKAKDSLNWTPLHYAIKTKNLEIVRILIEHGSEINALANRKEGLNSSTWSPLCGAVQKANLELVKLLIEYGAELNPKTKNSGVPLHFAVTSAFSNEERKKAANFEVIKYLIEKGAEVDGKNARGKTPLYYAVKNNLDMEIVEYFITKGADSYAKNGQTLVADDFCPLQMAIVDGRMDMINCFIKAGAKIDADSDSDWNPLHCATSSGHLNIVELLIKSGANVNARISGNPLTPLQLAVKENKLDILELFLKHNADIEAKTFPELWTPLHMAVFEKQLKIAEVLIEKGANVDAVTEEKNTPLHLIISRLEIINFDDDTKEIIELLIDSDANIEAVNEDGCTPIHFAVANKQLEVVKVLHGKGAKLDVSGANENEKPLHVAAKSGDTKTVEYLVDSGANINSRDDENRTPLHVAVSGGHLEVVEFLLQNNQCDVNSMTKSKSTPLHEAVHKRHLEIVKLLIKKKANVNAGALGEQTPLHDAAKNGCREIVEVLVRAKANTDEKDANDYTPLNLASLHGHTGIVAFMQQSIARDNYKKRKRSVDKIVEKQINFTDSCIICCNPRDNIFAFQPCGHSLACKKCSETLLKKGNPKCPYCRAVVTHYQQIFVQQSEL